MKFLLINLIVFVIVVNSDMGKRLFLPQLPLGEYRIKLLGILRCDFSKENVKFNYYLNKTSASSTQIEGNFTTTVPIDDSLNASLDIIIIKKFSLDIEIEMAVKDSIGGWKNNAHLFKTPKACSTLKSFFGDSWNRVLAISGIHVTDCPIPRGTYCLAPGLITDSTDLISQFPKKFFYGTYQMRFRYTKHKETYGCLNIVLDVKRPWETD